MLKIVAILLVTCLLDLGTPHIVGNNPNHRREVLDSQGKYVLEWRIDWEGKRVTFNVTAETRGWVGFGLSRNGKMSGADVVIGGVRKNGKAYFSDRYAVGNQVPEIDSRQDWVLHWAKESRTHTMLSFSRAFDTCDPQDYRITEDRIALIWAYGVNDNESQYHFRSRGVFNVHLLSLDYTPEIITDVVTGAPKVVGEEYSDVKVWSVRSALDLPPGEDTVYWCTMHKAPRLPRKHHLVGMNLRFATEQSRPYMHHILVFKCTAPRSRDAKTVFGPFVGQAGQECILMRAPTGPMPTEYCTEHVKGWAIGGRAYFHPPHVGFPFTTSPDEYYAIQIHYDNPSTTPTSPVITVDFTMDFFYTPKLRKYDGGLLTNRVPSPGLPPTVLVPPSSIDHNVVIHCSPECTRRILPSTGIQIYTTLHHAHNSAVEMRIHHFRSGRELPWISTDSNYGNTFQTFSAPPEEINVLPGDQITTRCVYDNTWTNGTVVGGFSTRQEMCAGYIAYYPKLEGGYVTCDSYLDSEQQRQRFLGVVNVTWSNADLEYHIDGPHPLQGLSITQVSDNHVDWTLKRRRELQKTHFLHPQVGTCSPELSFVDVLPEELEVNKHGVILNPEEFRTPARYPVEAVPYSPNDYCDRHSIT